MSSWASFPKCVECRTVSNALLKSRHRTMTYGFVVSMCVTVWKRWMSAAVVKPVGRKAYWSSIDRVGGAVINAGYKYRLTTVRSMIRARTEVIEMGRKSVWLSGEATLGTVEWMPSFIVLERWKMQATGWWDGWSADREMGHLVWGTLVGSW